MPSDRKHVAAYARKFTKEMVDVWLEVARDKTAPPAARITAADKVVTRGWGTTPERVDLIKQFTPEQIARAAAQLRAEPADTEQ